MQLSPSIFKAYDIRGIIDQTLDPSIAKLIGQAFGTEMRELGETEIVIGRDGRLSGPSLIEALTEGLLSTGINVIDLGMVATPMVYFGANQVLDGKKPKSGIMITGSHNPPNYNGFKMVLGGAAIYGDQIQALRKRIEAKQFASGQGTRSAFDIFPMYLERIVGDVKLARPMKIAVDCGNGVGGAFAGKLFRALGCEVQELFCEVDGKFPNHHPDPAHLENLQDLIKNLQTTDNELGLAFDGDADRCFLIDEKGQLVTPSALTALISVRELKRKPNSNIIYNLISSKAVPEVISENGGTPIRSRVGHSFIKKQMAETNAIFGGEHSGHFYFADFWRADSGMLAALFALTELFETTKPLSELLKPFNRYVASGEINTVVKDIPSKLQAIREKYGQDHQIDELDGITVSTKDYWFNVRASNTEPLLRLNVEGDTKAIMEKARDAALAIIKA